MEKLLKICDVMGILDVKKQTIYGWIHRGVIPVIRLSGRAVRFRGSDIENFIAAKFQDVVSQPEKPEIKERSMGKSKRTDLDHELADRILRNAKKEAGA